MSSPCHESKKTIKNKGQLVAWFEKGCTPAENRLIGVEHEKPMFHLDDFKPPSYEGDNGHHGIKDFIETLIAQKGWQAGELENGLLIDAVKNGVGATFEPGCQAETGGAPLKNVHENASETDRILNEWNDAASSLGLGLLAQGFHPTHRGEEMPLMPKSRYLLLNEYIDQNHFANAHDVLSCTSTVQVNMGYMSEADMVKMLRVSLSLQPIAVSLFANSPFYQGKPSGMQSLRSHKLYNNLNGRYGFMLPIAFDEGFGFEMFVDYALNTMPVMGIYKGNVFIDAKGGTFNDFMHGALQAVPGQKATIDDWQNHLNTIWPEVRVRKFLEMRGCDNGPAEMIKALPAFWVGLLYDQTALNAAYDVVKNWTQQDRDYLRIMTPNTGLQTKFLKGSVQDVALECLKISEAGLKRRNILNSNRYDESVYLAPLFEIASGGQNWAQRLEYKFRNEWRGDITKLFNEMSYANNPSVFKVQVAMPAAKKKSPQNSFKH